MLMWALERPALTGMVGVSTVSYLNDGFPAGPNWRRCSRGRPPQQLRPPPAALSWPTSRWEVGSFACLSCMICLNGVDWSGCTAASAWRATKSGS